MCEKEACVRNRYGCGSQENITKKLQKTARRYLRDMAWENTENWQ